MLTGVVLAQAVHKPEFPPIFDRKLSLIKIEWKGQT